MFAWKEIVNNLKKLSEDDSKLEKIIEEQMMTIIKESHPNDYEDFINANKLELEDMRLRLKEKYKKEVHMRVSNLFSPAAS
jgi:hypothetical protein